MFDLAGGTTAIATYLIPIVTLLTHNQEAIATNCLAKIGYLPAWSLLTHGHANETSFNLTSWATSICCNQISIIARFSIVPLPIATGYSTD